ncbi:MAG: hypothetical protein AAGF87_09275 [Bacteroidota bacterium]
MYNSDIDKYYQNISTGKNVLRLDLSQISFSPMMPITQRVEGHESFSIWPNPVGTGNGRKVIIQSLNDHSGGPCPIDDPKSIQTVDIFSSTGVNLNSRFSISISTDNITAELSTNQFIDPTVLFISINNGAEVKRLIFQ